MPTLLPQDSDKKPIPAMRLKPGGAHGLNVTLTPARTSTAFDNDTRVVSVYATVPVYMAFGDNAVTASSADHYFPAQIYYDFAIGSSRTGQNRYLSALAVDVDGEVYISEKE